MKTFGICEILIFFFQNAYIEYREIKAAQGVKIAAKELEKAIAGLNLYVANKPDETEILKEEVAKELKSALSNIKLQERGVYVQASTLGSLEALLDFLRTSKIPVSELCVFERIFCLCFLYNACSWVISTEKLILRRCQYLSAIFKHHLVYSFGEILFFMI